MSRGSDRVSPWVTALGPAVAPLHPHIRAYVEALPARSIGRGDGVFELAGTPRSWLRPVLVALARQGVLAPMWQRAVPFTVSNRLGSDGVLTAERTFVLPRGSWTMHDAVSCSDGRLHDDLGTARRYRATLTAWVADGALRLRSTEVSVRLGRVHLRVPAALAPVVLLREGWDEAADRQRVQLRLEHPLLGVLYEYRGTFVYRVEQEAP